MSSIPTKTVPADFRKFVHYIETSQHIYINLSWSSIEEFKDCIAYYFERAISNLEWTKRFADRAAKLSLLRTLSGDNALRKINFKDVLVKESKRRLEEFYQKLESDDSYTLDQAIRLMKFVGELFNVEILSLEFLKRQMEILESRIPRCSKSSRCYFLLIGVVKATVKTMSELDYSLTAKNLLKTIEEAELNRFISPGTPKSTPLLSPSSEKSFTRFQTPTTMNDNNEQLERFKRVLEDLTPTNAADVIKKIEKDHQNIVKGGNWQIYYDVMMEKALTKHKLAEAVIILCQKIASIGPGIKNGDFRKHMSAYIHKSIEKLFGRSQEDAQNRIFGVAHFVEKMIDRSQSLCSIGTISSFIEVILNNRSKNDALASKILMQMLFSIKGKTNCEKIRKLPESMRIISVQLITSKLSEDPKYGKHVGMFEEYLLGRKSEPSPPVRVQNIPTHSVSQESVTALKEFKGFTNTQVGPPAMPSSPNVKQQIIHNVESITAMRQNSMPAAVVQPTPSPISPSESYKFDTIIEVISNVNFNDIESCVKTIKLMNIRKAEEVNCLAVTIVQQSLLVQDLTPEYAKLIQQLTKLQFNIGNAPANVFKVLLINAYQQKLNNWFNVSLPFDPSCATEVYCLIQLITEIYKVNVVDQTSIENCIESFFRFEYKCEYAVQCISLLLTAVGEEFERKHEDVLNKYFRYFERIAEKETSSRASVFQELLTLRKNKWNVIVEIPKPIELSPGISSSPPPHLFCSTPSSPVASTSSQSVATTASPPPIASASRAESPVQPTTQITSMVIDFQELTSNIELESVAHVLKQHLKSASQVKSLITAILGHPFNNFNEISSCVNLFKTLADIEVSTKAGLQITFRECLLEVFNVELIKTRSSSFDQKKDNTKSAFGHMIVMVGELYKNDLYSDDDLDIWLCHKNLSSTVAVEILAHFSSLIAQKILNHGHDQTLLLLKFLEKSIQTLTIEACHSMKNDINEVDGLFRRVMNSKFDNED